MCKHQNCVIYEEFTISNEIVVRGGVPGKTVEEIQPPFPTGRLLVICRDCGMEKMFGARWPKWLQKYLDQSLELGAYYGATA